MTTDTRKLLVIEDDPGLQTQLKWCFEGYEVIIAGDRDAALSELEKHRPPVVTLDLGLPPDADGTSEGFQTLEDILSRFPATKVIVVTGNNDRQNALRVGGGGRLRFFHKPIDADMLGFIVNRAYRLHELESENQRLHFTGGESPLEGVITGSPEMMKVCRTVEKVAPSDATVLVLGESGHGQGADRAVAARPEPTRPRAASSPSTARRFPRTLLESELFGYEKGAFTGAVKQTPGKIEMARAAPCSSTKSATCRWRCRPSCCVSCRSASSSASAGARRSRWTCAWSAPPTRTCRQDPRKEFREDLYYRISEISVRIPPLREREGDTCCWRACSWRNSAAAWASSSTAASARTALAALEAYPWPGNVRELENRVKRAVIMAEHKQITRRPGVGRRRHGRYPHLQSARNPRAGRASGDRACAGPRRRQDLPGLRPARRQPADHVRPRQEVQSKVGADGVSPNASFHSEPYASPSAAAIFPTCAANSSPGFM
jgi:two-component system, NtrC family, response regulator